MKKYNLTNGVFAALLLASPMVGAETKYPAADFQPEVIYQDSEYIGKQKGQPSASTSKARPSAAGTSRAQSKYPAADFQPEVVFQDAEQIEKLGRAAVAPTRGRTAAPSEPAAGSGAEEATGGLMENYWVGLVGLALAGFAVLYSRRTKPEAAEPAAYTIDASGLTGVARYVRMQNMAAPTGVQKYLEKHVKEFTGVEKYLRERD